MGQIGKQDYPFQDSDGGIAWDNIVPTFNTLSDVYSFYKDGLLKKTITITYTNSSKSVISDITKV